MVFPLAKRNFSLEVTSLVLGTPIPHERRTMKIVPVVTIGSVFCCVLPTRGFKHIRPSQRAVPHFSYGSRHLLWHQRMKAMVAASDSNEGEQQQEEALNDTADATSPTSVPSPITATNVLPAVSTPLPLLTQIMIVLAFYFVHTLVLSRGCLAFPVQLFPNKHGLFQSIGLDSLAGFIVAIAGLVARPWSSRAVVECDEETETNVARDKAGDGAPERKIKTMLPLPWSLTRTSALRLRCASIGTVLIVAHYLSGYVGLLIEYVLYGLAAAGLPLTIAMHRSLQVLLSHLVWVFFGTKVLGTRLKPFFSLASAPAYSVADTDSADETVEELKNKRWISMKWRSSWVWWVVGGYYISSFVFSLTDLLNQFILPESAFEATDSVVTLMINPENNDRLAMAVASIAPCMTAPWWEEILYRGFMLPAIAMCMPRRLQGWLAIPLSGLLFGLHHQALHSLLPLTALGAVWALLYRLSSNMVVTIIIHSMWNSRVFLGSALGL